MRIVIEIDQLAANSQQPTPLVFVGGVSAPESRAPAEPVETFAKGRATTGEEDAMSMNAGCAYPIEVAGGGGNVPPELLVRAVSLNALSAGPAPGFIVDEPVRTAVTHADSSESLLTRAGDDPFIPACSLEAARDGGITNAGAAPE